MSSCFYDMRGGMLGLDKHIYWKLVKGAGWPGIVVGLPDEKWHAVGSMHDWNHNANHTTTVTSEGNLMLKKDFSMEYIPHIPLVTDPPSVLGVAWLIGVIVRSKSEPVMHMPSVTGQGTALACCVYSMIGVNKNCGGYGVVINPNTVVTSPSLGDFAQVLLGMLVNQALDWVVDKLIGIVFPSWRFPVPNLDSKNKPKFQEIPNPFAEVTKWAFEEYVKKPYIDPFVEQKVKDVTDGL